MFPPKYSHISLKICWLPVVLAHEKCLSVPFRMDLQHKSYYTEYCTQNLNIDAILINNYS